MAKEWILNSAMNRFQLNFKRNVGATSEAIRICSPKSLQQWRDYYFKNVKSEEQIEELGKRLYVKISEVIRSEVDNITEQDCIDYMKQMVIERTYDGYCTEIETIYGQLQSVLACAVEPAPDEWDRKYNVDFFIKVNDSFIGIQIKPVNNAIQLPEIHKEYANQMASHKSFEKKYGGKVFYVFSSKVDGRKTIANPSIVKDILSEIKRLQSN